MDKFTANMRWHQDPVLDGQGLRDGAQDFAALEVCSSLQFGGEGPDPLPIQGRHRHAPDDEGAGGFGQDREGALHAIEDMAHQTRADLHGEGRALAGDGVAGLDAAGVLIDLDGGHVLV